MVNMTLLLRYLRPQLLPMRDYEVHDGEAGQFIAVWRSQESQPTPEQLAAAEPAVTAAIAAEAAAETGRQQSNTAAKAAYAQLQTIIDGIDAATLVQAKTAIKQIAVICQHLIKALVR